MDIKDFKFDLSLTPTDKMMLAEIADMVDTPDGAFNIRKTVRAL